MKGLRQKVRDFVFEHLFKFLESGEENAITWYIETLVENFCESLRPHIDKLATIAQVYGASQGASKQLPQLLQADLAQVMREAIKLKLQLERAETSHRFVWPSHGVDIDLQLMSPKHQIAGSGQHEVAFPLFPGIRVDWENGEGMKRVSPAEVMNRHKPVPPTSAMLTEVIEDSATSDTESILA